MDLYNLYAIFPELLIFLWIDCIDGMDKDKQLMEYGYSKYEIHSIDYNVNLQSLRIYRRDSFVFIFNEKWLGGSIFGLPRCQWTCQLGHQLKTDTFQFATIFSHLSLSRLVVGVGPTFSSEQAITA